MTILNFQEELQMLLDAGLSRDEAMAEVKDIFKRRKDNILKSIPTSNDYNEISKHQRLADRYKR